MVKTVRIMLSMVKRSVTRTARSSPTTRAAWREPRLMSHKNSEISVPIPAAARTAGSGEILRPTPLKRRRRSSHQSRKHGKNSSPGSSCCGFVRLDWFFTSLYCIFDLVIPAGAELFNRKSEEIQNGSNWKTELEFPAGL